MSYPQPIASREVIQGQSFFRLFTELESAGDVYELDVSATAFAIGPQSDIAKARITYYDPERPGNAQSFVVSIDTPFVGRIDADLSATYPANGAQARILVSIDDLYENNWRPTVDALDFTSYVPPKLDLLAYIGEAALLPTKRADQVQRGRFGVSDNGGGTGSTWIIVPFYRRKFASIKLSNYSASVFAVNVNGIGFTTDADQPVTVPSDYRVQTTSIVSGGALAAAVGPGSPGFYETRVRASAVGLFDYLVVEVAGPAVDAAAVNNALWYTLAFVDEEV